MKQKDVWEFCNTKLNSISLTLIALTCTCLPSKNYYALLEKEISKNVVEEKSNIWKLKLQEKIFSKVYFKQDLCTQWISKNKEYVSHNQIIKE